MHYILRNPIVFARMRRNSDKFTIGTNLGYQNKLFNVHAKSTTCQRLNFFPPAFLQFSYPLPRNFSPNVQLHMGGEGAAWGWHEGYVHRCCSRAGAAQGLCGSCVEAACSGAGAA